MKSKENKTTWFVESAQKHTIVGLLDYLRSQLLDEVWQFWEIEGKGKVRMLSLPREAVKNILSDGDKFEKCNFYLSQTEGGTPQPISIKDALALLTGQHISSKIVPKILEKSANKNFSSKILQSVQSEAAIMKEKGKKYFFSRKLYETYQKESITTKDLRGRDLAIVQKLREFFSNVTIERQRKNYYFKIFLE